MGNIVMSVSIMDLYSSAQPQKASNALCSLYRKHKFCQLLFITRWQSFMNAMYDIDVAIPSICPSIRLSVYPLRYCIKPAKCTVEIFSPHIF